MLEFLQARPDDKRYSRKLKHFLIGLIALIVLMPLSTLIPGNTVEIILLTAVMLLGANAATAGNRKNKWFIIGLLVLAILFAWASFLLTSPVLNVISIVFSVLFFALITIEVFSYVLLTKKVNMDVIYGAIAAYLMIAITFAVMYAGIEEMNPGSFNPVGAEFGAQDFFYFSMVTITTLGYGDISPIASFARSLVMLQVIIGVFFLAIILARLLGKMDIE